MTTRITPGVGANLLGQHSAERNQDATAYVGNLDPQVRSLLLLFFLSSFFRLFFSNFMLFLFLKVTEELLWELFVQAGPVGMHFLVHSILPNFSCVDFF